MAKTRRIITDADIQRMIDSVGIMNLGTVTKAINILRRQEDSLTPIETTFLRALESELVKRGLR